MEEFTIAEHNKKGITRIDIVHIIIIVVMIIIYVVLLSKTQIPSPSNQSVDNKKIKINTSTNDDVSTLDIIISIWGFILGLFVSSFVTRFIFREYSSNITIILITFIFSISILILYYVGTNYQNADNGENWVRYNQIVFPLVGGLFLISEDAINHLFEYFGGDTEKYTNLDKLAGGLIEIRQALAKNNILSDTSTDYKGSSDITSEYFTPDSL
jgi:hypothetical protein